MLNNSFSQYMSFMYNNYPSGFGDKLKENFDKKIISDGAEIFNDLINKY